MELPDVDTLKSRGELGHVPLGEPIAVETHGDTDPVSKSPLDNKFINPSSEGIPPLSATVGNEKVTTAPHNPGSLTTLILFGHET